MQKEVSNRTRRSRRIHLFILYYVRIFMQMRVENLRIAYFFVASILLKRAYMRVNSSIIIRTIFLRVFLSSDQGVLHLI